MTTSISLSQSAWAQAEGQKHGVPAPPPPPGPATPANPTPEERMASRFPQPVLIGRLVGMPVQDDKDRIIGRVSQVVRGHDNKIKLIVPYSAHNGWAPQSILVKKRPVAVPIETVVILGAHLNALEFTRPDFDKAPTWAPGQDRVIPWGEMTRVALGAR